MKLSFWIVSFQEQEEIKRNVVIDVFILIYVVSFDQPRPPNNKFIFYIRENELDGLRLDFGSVRL